MERPAAVLPSPGWDASLLRGYFTPLPLVAFNFAGSHLHTQVVEGPASEVLGLDHETRGLAIGQTTGPTLNGVKWL